MSTATASSARLRAPPARDPAWLGRVFWTGAGLVLLWPMLVATEFRPWILVEASNLKVTRQFLASFVPPALSADFLAMVARETWRTVAIATAGLTLALLLAWPLTLLSTRVLSVSALSGRMARGPFCTGVWADQGPQPPDQRLPAWGGGQLDQRVDRPELAGGGDQECPVLQADPALPQGASKASAGQGREQGQGRLQGAMTLDEGVDLRARILPARR